MTAILTLRKFKTLSPFENSGSVIHEMHKSLFR